MLTRDKFINTPIAIKAELLLLFKEDDNLTIFDIGACEAEDAIRYSMLFPNATVYAFEPRADNIGKARELLSIYNKPAVVLEQLALSNKNGSATFFLSEGEPATLKNDEHWNYGNKSSSLLPPTNEIKKHTGWLSFNNKIEVTTIKLADYVTGKKINSIDFVHMDVQGAELMVLEGAGSFLSNIKLIWLEVEAVELYKGQPLKNDIEHFMQKNGFTNILDQVDQVSGDQLYLNNNAFSAALIQQLKSRKPNSGIASRLKRIFKRKYF